MVYLQRRRRARARASQPVDNLPQGPQEPLDEKTFRLTAESIRKLSSMQRPDSETLPLNFRAPAPQSRVPSAAPTAWPTSYPSPDPETLPPNFLAPAPKSRVPSAAPTAWPTSFPNPTMVLHPPPEAVQPYPRMTPAPELPRSQAGSIAYYPINPSPAGMPPPPVVTKPRASMALTEATARTSGTWNTWGIEQHR